MTQICSEASRIAQDPRFYITSALLWVRRSETNQFHSNESQDDHKEESPNNIEYNEDLGLLHLHRDRLLIAADAFGWRNIRTLHAENSTHTIRTAIDAHLSSLPKVPQGHRESRKLRILVNKNGELNIDSSTINIEPANAPCLSFIPLTLDFRDESSDISESRPICEVFLDLEATRPSTFTTHKTTHRTVYDAARKRLGHESYLPTKKEVLLYNPYGEIMEGSSSTVYFNRNGQWITPAAICGANVGVTRRVALENGLCKQGTLDLRDVEDGEYVWLSNAVRGFFLGKVHVTAIGNAPRFNHGENDGDGKEQRSSANSSSQ